MEFCKVASQPSSMNHGFAGPHEGGMALLDVEQCSRLKAALAANVFDDEVILMDRSNTTFIGTAEEVPEDEVINAVRSVPCHY